MNSRSEEIRKLQEKGYFLLPIPRGKKWPPPKGWPDHSEPYEILEGGNVAISTRDVAILITNDQESTTWAIAKYGEPNVLSFRGAHWYFKPINGQVNEPNKMTAVGTMEFHVHNKYALIPPSIHPSGTLYRWKKLLQASKELPSAPDLKDLFHPEGTHHNELLKQSAAKARAGESANQIFDELARYRDEHLPDPDAHTEYELRSMADSAFSKFHGEAKEHENQELKGRFRKSVDRASGDEIRITISSKDHVSAIIRNGSEGVIVRYREYQKPTTKGKSESKEERLEILRFSGKIGPGILLEGELVGIKLDINGEQKTISLQDAVSYLKRTFSLTQQKTQGLIEVLNAYIQQERRAGNLETVFRDAIHLKDGVIECTYPTTHDIKKILETLLEFYPHATYPDAFLSSLSRNLVAPLHFEVKRRVDVLVKIPFGLNQGTTGAGKTLISAVTIGTGYDQPKESWYFQYENVRTFFALMKHLTTSNLPCLYSDVSGDWILKNKESFKSYSQKGNMASRGTANQNLNEYTGLRTFDIDTNSTIRVDDDAAMTGRFASHIFTTFHVSRANRKRFIEFEKSLPTGFMFDLFTECFAGRPIDEIVTEVEGFETPKQWEDYGLSKINGLCKKFNLSAFEFQRHKSEDPRESNALNVAYAFIDQYAKDHETIEKFENGEPIRVRKSFAMFSGNQLKVTRLIGLDEGWTEILFQPTAYEILLAKLNLQVPHRKASEFVSNIVETDTLRVLFDGKVRGTWMQDSTRYVYGLKMRIK